MIEVSGQLVAIPTLEGEISQAELEGHTARVENWVKKGKGMGKATQESYDELQTYVQTLEAHVAIEKKEREKWLREVAKIWPMKKMQQEVQISKDTYEAWDLKVWSLKKHVRKAEELIVRAEELPKVQTRIIIKSCWNTYVALGQVHAIAPIQLL